MSRRRIDFREDQDLMCCLLGETGLFSKAISRETGLSPGQVDYRLRIAGIKRSSYRNGESDMSRLVLSQVASRHAVRTSTAAATKINKFLTGQEKRLARLTIERLNGQRLKQRKKRSAA